MLVLAFLRFQLFLAQIAEADPSLLAAELLKAIGSGQWVLALVIAVTGLTILARKVGARWWPWLGTKTGSVVVAVVGSISGALLTAITAHGVSGLTLPLILKLVLEAAIVAGVALLPSAAAAAKAKGDEAAAKVDSVDAALEEINK
jgi:hypothetical protein